MAAVAHWVTLRSSSTSTSPRSAAALIVVFHTYVDTLSCMCPGVCCDQVLTVLIQAHEQHRPYLESLPSTTYPLKPTGHPAEVNETQRITNEGFEQR